MATKQKQVAAKPRPILRFSGPQDRRAFGSCLSSLEDWEKDYDELLVVEAVGDCITVRRAAEGETDG
jgi:hypothetical protein